MTVGRGSNGRCQVLGSEKLLAQAGGTASLCSEIDRAVAALAPAAHYSAEIKVVSKSRLSATLVVNDRTLPEQHFAIMDSELDRGAIQRFARSLAEEVAKAAKP